jgi:hypothetical protein
LTEIKKATRITPTTLKIQPKLIKKMKALYLPQAKSTKKIKILLTTLTASTSRLNSKTKKITTPPQNLIKSYSKPRNPSYLIQKIITLKKKIPTLSKLTKTLTIITTTTLPITRTLLIKMLKNTTNNILKK